MFPSRSRKGFTLLELVVVLIVVGLLAALAIPTFQRVLDRTSDEVALLEMRALQRAAGALVSSDAPEGKYSVNVFEDALPTVEATGAGVPGTVGVMAASKLTIMGGQETGPVPSTTYGAVSVAVNPSGTRSGVAMRSEAGNCARVWALHGRETAAVIDRSGDPCVATAEPSSTGGDGWFINATGVEGGIEVSFTPEPGAPYYYVECWEPHSWEHAYTYVADDSDNAAFLDDQWGVETHVMDASPVSVTVGEYLLPVEHECLVEAFQLTYVADWDGWDYDPIRSSEPGFATPLPGPPRMDTLPPGTIIPPGWEPPGTEELEVPDERHYTWETVLDEGEPIAGNTSGFADIGSFYSESWDYPHRLLVTHPATGTVIQFIEQGWNDVQANTLYSGLPGAHGIITGPDVAGTTAAKLVLGHVYVGVSSNGGSVIQIDPITGTRTTVVSGLGATPVSFTGFACYTDPTSWSVQPGVCLYAAAGTTIHRIDLATNNATPFATTSNPIRTITAMPGPQIAVVTDNGVARNLAGSTLTTPAPGAAAYVGDNSWEDNVGTWIATGTDLNQVGGGSISAVGEFIAGHYHGQPDTVHLITSDALYQTSLWDSPTQMWPPLEDIPALARLHTNPNDTGYMTGTHRLRVVDALVLPDGDIVSAVTYLVTGQVWNPATSAYVDATVSEIRLGPDGAVVVDAATYDLPPTEGTVLVRHDEHGNISWFSPLPVTGVKVELSGNGQHLWATGTHISNGEWPPPRTDTVMQFAVGAASGGEFLAPSATGLIHQEGGYRGVDDLAVSHDGNQVYVVSRLLPLTGSAVSVSSAPGTPGSPILVDPSSDGFLTALMKFSATNGWEWVSEFTSNSNYSAWGFGVSLDAAGLPVVAGQWNYSGSTGPLHFGSGVSIPHPGMSDSKAYLFLTTYGTDGTALGESHTLLPFANGYAVRDFDLASNVLVLVGRNCAPWCDPVTIGPSTVPDQDPIFVSINASTVPATITGAHTTTEPRYITGYSGGSDGYLWELDSTGVRWTALWKDGGPLRWTYQDNPGTQSNVSWVVDRFGDPVQMIEAARSTVVHTKFGNSESSAWVGRTGVYIINWGDRVGGPAVPGGGPE